MNKQQFEALPLSEAILVVIEDLRFFTRIGMKVDMSTWYSEYEYGDNTKCAGCLGGMAVLGTKECATSVQTVAELVHCNIKNVREDNFKITSTFNAIRKVEYEDAFRYWYGFYPFGQIENDLCDLRYEYRGFSYELDSDEIEDLIHNLYDLSLTLYLAGY